MNSSFRKRFARDLKKVSEPGVLAAVKQAILAVELADGLQDLSDLK